MKSLETRLGYRFGDRSILERALTHRSSAHEKVSSVPRDHYERMEFLGDALLGFLVSERLMGDDPAADEGTLTRRKQSVVRTGALAEVSRRLGLGEALRLGRGEDQSGGRTKPSLLADAFESVLAAVYLDGGIRSARAFVRRHLKAELAATVGVVAPAEDAKTTLQELVQAKWRVTPRYRIVGISGPAHARTFTAEVLLEERPAGEGSGASRKDAERAAARAALRDLAERA
ncbi:MAG TPA: ribonuclease III [Candidatus Polarisedimenticolaceae bacterium]|nr:ribonuclease III [Candidatus Polarisedimenticolaceae bacterium]